jgi:hypothetical protein
MCGVEGWTYEAESGNLFVGGLTFSWCYEYQALVTPYPPLNGAFNPSP